MHFYPIVVILAEVCVAFLILEPLGKPVCWSATLRMPFRGSIFRRCKYLLELLRVLIPFYSLAAFFFFSKSPECDSDILFPQLSIIHKWNAFSFAVSYLFYARPFKMRFCLSQDLITIPQTWWWMENRSILDYGTRQVCLPLSLFWNNFCAIDAWRCQLTNR